MKKNNLKTLIITCWAVLVLCFIIKIFGGNWFELGAENIKFIQFCNFVDNNIWLKMIINCILYCASTYILLCIFVNKKLLSIKQSLFIIPIMITKSILSWWFYWIAFAIDVILLLGITTIISKKPLRSIICFVGINVYQIISLIIRNIGLGDLNENNFIIMILLQLDYYIMLVLCYLYNIKSINRKEK